MLRVKSGFPGRINHITLLVFTYDIINFNRLSNASGSSSKMSWNVFLAVMFIFLGSLFPRSASKLCERYDCLR